MRTTTIKTAIKTIYKHPNGKERSVNDAIYYGVGKTPYANVNDLKKAKVKFIQSKNSAWGHLADPVEAEKFLRYLKKEDGNLYYSL